MFMSFWKKIPYWLKGGIIGGGVTLIFVGLAYTCPFFSPDDGWGCAFSFYIPLIPFLPLLDNMEIARSFFQAIPFALLPIFYVVMWFIIGSLIGVVAGYIKSKKKNSQ